eukprot:scaffold8001_cov125-Isochrysis_galbana.AAC.10
MALVSARSVAVARTLIHSLRFRRDVMLDVLDAAIAPAHGRHANHQQLNLDSTRCAPHARATESADRNRQARHDPSTTALKGTGHALIACSPSASAHPSWIRSTRAASLASS